MSIVLHGLGTNSNNLNTLYDPYHIIRLFCCLVRLYSREYYSKGVFLGYSRVLLNSLFLLCIRNVCVCVCVHLGSFIILPNIESKPIE